MFLHDSTVYNERQYDDNLFSFSQKEDMFQSAQDLINKSAAEYNNSDSNKITFNLAETSVVESASLEDILQKRIEKASNVGNKLTGHFTLKKQFELFELTKTRSSTLDMLYNDLLSIVPSSVESERCFSSAGRFVTKFRCRMSDNTLDNLVMLRHYFCRN